MSYEDNKFVFDFAFQPLSEQAPANAPGNYVVNTNDTLRGIAQAVYGDQKLWYLIADANALQSDADLKAGTSLRIPSYASTTHSDSTTFKPYNHNEIVGDTTPQAVPPPPQTRKCEALSAIIQIVVTIVVTYYTGGNVYAGAAAGDAAGQASSAMLNGEFDWRAFGKGVLSPKDNLIRMAAFMVPGATDYLVARGARGDQRAREILNPLDYGMDYDYRRTGIAVAAAYVSQYVGGKIPTSWGQAAAGAVQAGAGYVATYGLNKAAGNDVHFSLRGLGASMAGGYAGGYLAEQGFVTSYAGSKAGAPQPFSWNQMLQDTLVNLTRSGINYAMNKAFDVKGSHWDGRSALVNAFGDVLGNRLVGAMSGGSPAQKQTDTAQTSRSTNTQTHELYSADELDQMTRSGPLFTPDELLASDVTITPFPVEEKVVELSRLRSRAAAPEFSWAPESNPDEVPSYLRRENILADIGWGESAKLFTGAVVDGFVKRGETIGSSIGLGLYAATHGEYDDTALGRVSLWLSDEFSAIDDHGFASTKTYGALREAAAVTSGTLGQLYDRGWAAWSDGYGFAKSKFSDVFEWFGGTTREQKAVVFGEFSGGALFDAASGAGVTKFAGVFGGVGRATNPVDGLVVLGRVQSRINLRNGSQAEGVGWNHAVHEHYSGKAGKSQFTVPQDELRAILKSKEVISAPVSQVLESARGPRYMRVIDLGRPIGVDKFTRQQTSIFTVLTDRHGNLVTTTPGVIK